MKKVTIIGMLLCIVILLVVEFYALATPQDGDTISEICWQTLKDYPILGIFSGIIIGHIAWPLTKDIRNK